MQTIKTNNNNEILYCDVEINVEKIKLLGYKWQEVLNTIKDKILEDSKERNYNENQIDYVKNHYQIKLGRLLNY